MPAVEQVLTVLRETPGIDNVEHRYVKEEYWTLSGSKRADDVHTFFYSGQSNVWAALQFVINYRGEIRYTHSSLALNERIPDEQLAATRPVVVDVEQRLKACCGLEMLSPLSGFGFPDTKQ